MDLDPRRAENVGIVGRVVDEHGEPHEGLLVAALDERMLRRPDLLGEDRTGPDGRFTLRYAPLRERALLRRAPNLRVAVFDARGIRLLAESRQYAHEREPVRDAGELVVPRREATGWFATLGRGVPLRVSHGNSLEALLDNERGFAEILDGIARAERNIHMAQLYLEPALQVRFARHDVDVASEPPDDDSARERARARAAARDGGGILVAALKAAAQRGVRIRIALNENIAVPDNVDEVRTALDGDLPQAGLVSVRASRRNPGVMHEKMVIVDDEVAYLPGSPFQQRYFDDVAHAPEARHRDDNQPHHDLTLVVRGPLVADLAEEFARLWNTSPTASRPLEDVLRAQPRATTVRTTAAPPAARVERPTATARGRATDGAAQAGAAPPAAGVKPLGTHVAGPHTVQLLSTTPTMGDMAGEASVLEAFERILAQAERYVYIENQYFTASLAARAISRALRSTPDLEIIMVLNEKMDIPTYATTQRLRLDELIDEHADRLAVFSMRSAGRVGVLEDERGGERDDARDERDDARDRGREGSRGGARAAARDDGHGGTRRVPRQVARRIYVHTKVTLADDRIASIGSANLDGVSLDTASELGMDGVRNEEINLLVPDGVEGRPRTGFVERLRRELWAHQLGLAVDAPALMREPAGGWRRLWRSIAEANARSLRGGRCELQGFVVPFDCDVPDDIRYEE